MKTDPKTLPRSLPVDLAQVALIDAATCSATGEMSVSWWHEEVRAGRAPAPAIQQVRCTRWRLVEVVKFWAERAASGSVDRNQTTTRAKKASDAARTKRNRYAAATAE